MDAQGFVAARAPAVTDANARGRFRRHGDYYLPMQGLGVDSGKVGVVGWPTRDGGARTVLKDNTKDYKNGHTHYECVQTLRRIKRSG